MREVNLCWASMYINNVDPYRSSRIDALAQQFIGVGGISRNDFLIIEPYSIGDVYHTLSLMDAFRKIHCTLGQRIHFVCNPRCLPVANLFQNIETATGLNCTPYEYHLEAFAGRYRLAPGFPIVTVPDMYADGWLGRLIASGKINTIDAKKLILNIDFNEALAKPKISKEHKDTGLENAKSQGLQPRSVIIFNHASSVTSADTDIYRCLSKVYPGRVYYDHSVPNAPDMPWAIPLKIPLDQVGIFAEYAGSVVALRSGIVDLLSDVECTLVTVYPSAEMIPNSFPDRASVAETIYNFRLSNLKLRLNTKEYILRIKDGENTDQTCENLRVLIENI